jgi:hypothetical protein
MGKKSRKEREVKRDSFATQRTKEKTKHTLIAVAVIGAIGIIVGISVYNFLSFDQTTPGAPPGAGTLGSEHVHASFLAKLHGDTFPFSGPAYQIKSSWQHFEAGDGTTIHRHATGVTLGFLFESMRIGLDDECFAYQASAGGERRFCTNEEFSLKFYVNHEPVDNLTDLVFKDGDRILLSYGGEDQTQIDAQLLELDSQSILG